jgi:broad specificity phosphatase PhoE
MKSHQSTQTMKPATAAKKLGVYLEATPAEFREGDVSRATLDELQANPPEWLRELRANGPHPRPVVAAKLGISISGLARGGITEALTTEQIEAIKQDGPEWLEKERATQAEVRKEAARIKQRDAEREAGS